MKDKQYIKMLKKAQLKVTPKRKAIIRFLLQNDKCFTPDEIWKVLRKKFGHLGLPTIYRNLKELENTGILVRIIRPDQRFHYAICRLGSEKKHHHFVCERCGRVKEVDFCNFKNIAEVIEKKLNSRIISHFLQVEGLCSQCK